MHRLTLGGTHFFTPQVILPQPSPKEFFRWKREGKMGFQPKYLLSFKLCVLLSLNIMPALAASVAEHVPHMRRGDRHLPYHEPNGIDSVLISSLTVPGSALHRRTRSRRLKPPSHRYSSLRLCGIIAATLAAAFIVLICFHETKAASTGSALLRNLDGRKNTEKLPRCPVGRSSC